jgi:thioredoxin-like negative regulator of GroEL
LTSIGASHGDSGGTRALVEVLLLHRHHPHADVVAGITAALSVGALSPDVVAVETRKHQQPTDHAAATDGPVVVSLVDRRAVALSDLTEQLPKDLRPLPSVAHYDSLLKGNTT